MVEHPPDSCELILVLLSADEHKQLESELLCAFSLNVHLTGQEVHIALPAAEDLSGEKDSGGESETV